MPRLLNDQPTLHDRLDLPRLVAEIGRSIAEGEPPQVFGLHGDWGAGKTSLLHQVQLYLSGRCPQQSDEAVKAVLKTAARYHDQDRCRVVWFDAWRYQHEPVPVVALLHEMREQLVGHVKLIGKLSKVAEIALRSSLLHLEDLTKKVGIQASKIVEVGKEWERERLATQLPANALREQLEHAIHGLLTATARRKERRVVVLIDDLDRCEPEPAYRLLEGLKIYLTLPNCVFVLGMNQRIIEDAVGKQVVISDDEKGTASARRKERSAAYIEKLCQNIWRVPPVREPHELLLEWIADDQNDVFVGWVREALGGVPCLPPNPRRIKGLANLLRRMRLKLPTTAAQGDRDEIVRETRRMFIVAMIYQFHHDLFRRWANDITFFDEIYKWCRSPLHAVASREATDPLKQLFWHLQPAVLVDWNESTPTPQSTFKTAYPDPGDSNVFWVQPLIAREEPRPDPSVFAPYLFVSQASSDNPSV